MKELSKKIHKQIEKVEDGKLKVEELEALVEDARDLYEKLIILKYKAYEKFGAPEKQDNAKSKDKKQEIVTEKTETMTEQPAAEKEETAFDFTESNTVKEEIEQPSFDFSISEEAASVFPVDEDIKNVAPKTEEKKPDIFPESDSSKSSKPFKDSHVEKHEAEDSNSLNQKLKTDEQLSLRKKLQNTPIKDLKTEISIAKKFEYITFMFDGKNEVYEAAIDSLNNCSSGDEAREKLNEFSTKYKWDLENKSIIKFVELVERRYL